jgi:hypothetical protein
LLSRSKQNELLQEDVVDSKFFEGVKTAQTLMFEGTRLFGKGGKVALIQACRECDWRRAARKTSREVLPRQAPSRASWPNIHLLTLEHGRRFPQAPSLSTFNPVSDFQQTQNVHNIADPRHSRSHLLNPNTRALEATWPHPSLRVNLDRS